MARRGSSRTDLIAGKYRIEKTLQRGDGSAVYLARSTRSKGKRRYAIKVLDGDRRDSLSVSGLEERFRILRGLDHPNLARIHAVGRQDDGHFVVTEYVEGEDLVTAIQGGGPAAFWRLTCEILGALAYLHSRNILHGDLKPGNILVSRRGAKLIDIGISRWNLSGKGPPPSYTLQYLAPEVIRGEAAGPPADLFSLGVTLYQALSGRLPFDGENAEEILRSILEEEAPPLTAAAGVLPPGAGEFLERLLARDPYSRYPSAAEAIHAIRETAGVDGPEEMAEVPRGYIYSGRMVERDGALSKLRALLDQPPTSRLAVVTGGPGLGKSRLAREFRYHCQARGVPFFEGTCPPGRSPAFFPFREVLRQVYGTADENPEVPPPVARFFGALPEGVRQATSDPGQDRDVFFEAVAVALSGGDIESTVVLHLDDLHQGSEETVRLASHLLRRLPGLRLIVSWDPVSPGREGLAEAMERLTEGEDPARIPLAPLTGEGVEALTRSMLGTPLPPSVALRIGRAAGGSPLFVTEVMRGLADRGVLKHGPGGWSVDPGQGEALHLPADVREDLRARVEGLAGEARQTLELISLFRDPPTPAVLDTLGVPSPPGPLEAMGWLRTRAGRYEVCPPLLRSLLSDGLDPDRLRAGHVRIGRALEETRGDPGEIAYHLLEGGDRKGGVEWGRLAARVYGPLSPPDAEEMLGRVLELLPGEEVETRLDLLDRLARARLAQGRSQEAIESWEEAIRLIEEGGGDPAEVALMHVRVSFARQDYEGVERHSREGIRLAPAEARPSLTADLCGSLGVVLFLMNRPSEATEFLKRSLDAARRGGDRMEMARAHHNLAGVQMRSGNSEGAAEEYARALRIAEGRHPEGEAMSLAGLADVDLQVGRYRQARDTARRALKVSTENAIPGERITALYNIGEASLHLGDVGAAMASWEEGARIGDLIGETALAAGDRAQMAGVRCLRSEVALARPLARSAARDLRGDSESTERPDAVRVLAECYLEAGLPGRAERVGRVAVSEAKEIEHHLSAGKGSLLLARVAVAQERWEDARRRIEEGKASFGVAGNAPYVAFAAAILARVHLAEGEAEAARRILDPLSTPVEERAHPRHQMDLAHAIAELRIADGDAKGAAAAAQDLLRMAEALGNKACLFEAYRLLNRISASLGDGAGERQYAYLGQEALEALLGRLPPRWRRRSLWRGILEEVKGRQSAREDASISAGSGKQEGEAFRRVAEIIASINADESLEEVLRKVVDGAVRIAEAERAFLVLQGEGGEEFTVNRNFDREEIQDPEVKVSRGVLRRCMERGEAVLTTNAQEDGRFREYVSVQKLRLRSILCIPLGAGGELLGAIYLDNRFRPAAFGQDERDHLERFAGLASLAIQSHRLLREARLARETLRQDVQKKGRQVVAARRALKGHSAYEEILGSSRSLREVFSLMDSIVPTEVPILIQGESGTGKELVARAIHDEGPRGEGPYLTINCSAMTDTLLESEIFGHVKGAFTGATSSREGLFRAADGGTLFLDEVAEMSDGMQKKLLRVIQDGEVRSVGGSRIDHVDVRILAATNKVLRDEVEAGRFREDLFYRLSVITVDLPPLREREEDAVLLAHHFLETFCRAHRLGRKRLSPGAVRRVREDPWPGNIRELKGCIEKAAILSAGPEITPADLGPPPAAGAAGGEGGPLTLDEAERVAVARAIAAAGGNLEKAGRILGVHPSTVSRKARKHKIPLR